ncbi:hypothetical protein [Mycobacterium sp.]|uniref:hypothetical protein n=1 Tax=Mycobacterium sp. TaxID=1785 RepID=UPI002D53F7F4|nr:hypothetical protein [Mycobacterium sp.]HZA11558.1 hypothetical protein [Mycobacterium sp.]
MTEPHDNPASRPISVAELLARNGTIGSPPISGRRRRRRGNDEAVTVAELTGEIPTIHGSDHLDHTDALDLAPTNGTAEREAEPLTEPEPVRRDERGPHPSRYEPDLDDYIESLRPARPRRVRAERGVRAERVRAEHMVPDPLDDDVLDDDVDDDRARGVALDEHAELDDEEDLPPYLRGEREHLFGGHTGHTGHSGHTGHDDVLDEDPTAEHDAAAGGPLGTAPQTTMQKALRGGLVVAQSIVAVAFGAGLFLAFDQLWKWNNIVALVLSVLVILGLVIAVRVVRKTEDIGSTLIAVAVGALVTLGPLALLQSG